MRDLRPYQAAGLDALRDTVRQGVKRIVLQLPTGGGKTRISAAIAQGVLKKGRRLAYVCPRIILIDQTVEEYWREGIRDEIGVIQGNHQLTDWRAPIQICSIDTIRSKGVFPDASVVIFDEGHVLKETHKKWMREQPQTIFIALTATPWAKGMGRFFDTLLVIETVQGLIDQHYLCPFRVFGPDVPDMRRVKLNAGEFAETESSEVMQKLTGNIIETWVKLWNKNKTLCFAVDLAHAKAIQERFLEAGITCGYQDARTPDSDRRMNKKHFHSGELRVVVSVGTLLLGTDWKVNCISDCQPTKSDIRHVQKIGRGLRTDDGKEFLTILDHAGNTAGRYDRNGKQDSLGYVTDIHRDHLDMGDDRPSGERRAPLPKKCPQCTMLRPSGTPKCPNCGFEAKPTSSLFEDDAELVELIPGTLPKNTRSQKRKYTIAEMAMFLAELKAYAAQHNYKNGWAFHKFEERFKTPPDRAIKNVTAAAYPSAAVVQWCRSRAIAWAKSRKSREISHV